MFELFSWTHFVPTHENAQAALDFLEKFITLGVLPATLTLFFRERKKERLAAQYQVYDSLDEHYGEFLKRMMDNPLLPVYPPDAALSLAGLTEPEQVKRLAAFELLVSIFERAFLMYRSEDLVEQDKQWSGWAACMQSWCTRPGWNAFYARINGDQFDRDFDRYLRELAAFVPVRGEALPAPKAASPAPRFVARGYRRLSGVILNYGMLFIPLALAVLVAIYITAPEKGAERRASAGLDGKSLVRRN